MCGIVYYNNLKGLPVNNKVIARYRAQRTRGTSGFGYYVPEFDRMVHNTKENRIIRLLERQSEGHEILFHHRFPTSTLNVRNAAHPFSTLANKELFKHQYVLVHNGVLQNHKELKTEHEKLGIKYVSVQPDGRFNDSEALLYDVALVLEGKQDELKAKGTIAFVVIEKDETGKAVRTHFARNYGNPLKIRRKDKEFLYLASEGKGKDVEPHMLYTFVQDTGILLKKKLIVPGYVYTQPTSFHASRTRDWDGHLLSLDAGDRRSGYDTRKIVDAVLEQGDRGEETRYVDIVVPNPMHYAPNMANLEYVNGYYDSKGYWHYYRSEDFETPEQTIGFQTPAQIHGHKFSTQVTAFVNYCLKENDDDLISARILAVDALATLEQDLNDMAIAYSDPNLNEVDKQKLETETDKCLLNIRVAETGIEQLRNMDEAELVESHLAREAA